MSIFLTFIAHEILGLSRGFKNLFIHYHAVLYRKEVLWRKLGKEEFLKLTFFSLAAMYYYYCFLGWWRTFKNFYSITLQLAAADGIIRKIINEKTQFLLYQPSHLGLHFAIFSSNWFVTENFVLNFHLITVQLAVTDCIIQKNGQFLRLLTTFRIALCNFFSRHLTWFVIEHLHISASFSYFFSSGVWEVLLSSTITQRTKCKCIVQAMPTIK